MFDISITIQRYRFLFKNKKKWDLLPLIPLQRLFLVILHSKYFFGIIIVSRSLYHKTINMKTFHSILIAILILFVFQLNAQENYQYKKIDGKEYILYSVQPGEGLYGIGRKFNIAVKELSTLNPEAANGLKMGQILLIPVTKDSKKAIATTNEPTTQSKLIKVLTPKNHNTLNILSKSDKRFLLLAENMMFRRMNSKNLIQSWKMAYVQVWYCVFKKLMKMKNCKARKIKKRRKPYKSNTL